MRHVGLFVDSNVDDQMPIGLAAPSQRCTLGHESD